MKVPGKDEDEVNLTRIIKKAKLRSTIRTVIVSLLISVLVLIGVMIGNVQLIDWSSSKVKVDEYLMEQISGPNQVETGYVDNRGFLSGTLEFYSVKVIEGVPLPWSNKKINYQVVPFFAFTSLGGSTMQSVSLPDAAMEKQGYEYTRHYNGLNGQRKILFYIPKVNYNDKILNDLPLLQEMDQDKLVEMAVSLDKDYSLSEVKQMIPLGLTQAWYWVDTYDNKKFYDPYIDGNGNKSYAIPESEDSVKGFGVPPSDPTKVTEKEFLDALERGVHLKGQYHYEFNRIYNYLKRDKAKPDESDIRILGVVVTGTAKELQLLSGKPYVRGVTLGAVVDKY